MIISAVLCNLLGCTAQQEKFESLDVDAFEKVISDTTVVRLDVRSIDEYASGHIAKAINIDVMKDDFTTKATSLLPKDKTIALSTNRCLDFPPDITRQHSLPPISTATPPHAPCHFISTTALRLN